MRTGDGGGEDWVKLMRSPLRQHVLVKYAERVMSPSDVAADLGAPLNLVSYHTQVLLRAGRIEHVRTERRRGAAKHFYRAGLMSEIGDEAWEKLPERSRRVLVSGTLDRACREARDALPRGGMDAGTAHVSRTFLELDGRGREELSALLTGALERAREIQATSRARGCDVTPQELAILSFEPASRP